MKKRKNPKRRVLENIAKKLDIPEDIIFNIPRITMMANKEIRIENCNSVLEYGFCRLLFLTLLQYYAQLFYHNLRKN